MQTEMYAHTQQDSVEKLNESSVHGINHSMQDTGELSTTVTNVVTVTVSWVWGLCQLPNDLPLMPQTAKKYQSERQEVTLLGMPQAVSEEAVIIIEVAFWEYWLQLTPEFILWTVASLHWATFSVVQELTVPHLKALRTVFICVTIQSTSPS